MPYPHKGNNKTCNLLTALATYFSYEIQGELFITIVMVTKFDLLPAKHAY